MDDRLKNSFDFLKATIIQFIGLSTGVLTLEISFKKDIAGPNITADVKMWLLWSWFSFLISVFFGLWTLLALTGTLASKKKMTPDELYKANIRFPSLLQILFFLAGLICTCIFAWLGI